jgi:hypothetical protein
MVDIKTPIDPAKILKGARVRIQDYDPKTVYIVDSVQRKRARFYAVSEDGSSGHWFDICEVVEIVS